MGRKTQPTNQIKMSHARIVIKVVSQPIEAFPFLLQKTPFATTDANSDLGKFYRECQVAPSLSMFESQSCVEETLHDITDQLVNFELQVKDFDEFVNALQVTEG